MSKVKNPNYFKNMSSFNLKSNVSSDIQCLGMYDSALGDSCICESTYLGDKWESKLVWQDHFLFGRRQVYANIPVYGKDSLNGRPCVFLYYKHYSLGNNFISKKLLKGHWHTSCVVSCNDISIIDFMRIDESKNIFFLGKLLEEMPVISDSWTYSLFVIEAQKPRFKN